MKEAASQIFALIAYVIKQFLLSKDDKAKNRKKKNKEMMESNEQQKSTNAKRRSRQRSAKKAYQPQQRLSKGRGKGRDTGFER